MQENVYSCLKVCRVHAEKPIGAQYTDGGGWGGGIISVTVRMCLSNALFIDYTTLLLITSACIDQNDTLSTIKSWLELFIF